VKKKRITKNKLSFPSQTTLMKLKYIVALCCCLSSTVLMAQQDTATWVSHTDTTYHFSLMRPDNWQFKLPGTNTRFFITSYAENDADKFRENINCIARRIEDRNFVISMAEDAIKTSIKEKMADYKELSSGYVKWNNTDALQLNYTCSQQFNGATVNLHIFQLVSVVKGILYTITFTSMTDSYDKYIGVVNKVVQSFKVE
jgi:hypothetical protein